MRLTDDVRNTVVYLGISDPNQPEVFSAAGTGFIVCIGRYVYLVTADHVAKALDDGGFCIRMNRHDNGLAQNHLIEHANWVRHPTESRTVDIAVLEFEIPDWADVKMLPYRAIISDFKFITKNIGPGDLAYVVGIFDVVSGKRRNIPAVHTGHVCLIPRDEPIPVEDWNAPPHLKPRPTIDVEAYLIEAPNTLPGGSGGPVFVRRSIQTRLFDKNVDANPKGIDEWVYGSVWLLGVWTDAWFGEPSRIIRLPAGRKLMVPLGIGVAVPSQKLIDVLNHPDLVARREVADAALNRARASTKTAVQPDKISGDDILHAMWNVPPKSVPKPKAKKAKRSRSGVSSSK